MSAISINNNTLAANTANNLTSHYSKLAISTQRLSTGLRINSAADDAAGLAIRELQRSDIAALEQGARNVNDAISMIQTFDGALGVIDEKLIRMKELAEQAATGTYDSTQRLMIDSEFQAMGAEINRIARATDFNGIKLISGIDKAGNPVLNPGDKTTTTIVGPDGKTYATTVTGSPIIAHPAGTTPPAITPTPSYSNLEAGITDPGSIGVGNTAITITNDSIGRIGNDYLAVTTQSLNIPNNTVFSFTYNGGADPTQAWTVTSPDIRSFTLVMGTDNLVTINGTHNNGDQVSLTVRIVNDQGDPANVQVGSTGQLTIGTQPSFSVTGGTLLNPGNINNGTDLTFQIQVGNNTITQTYAGAGGINSNFFMGASININVKDTTPGTNDPDADDPDSPLSPNYTIPDDAVRIHFGPEADKKEDFYDIRMYDCTLKGLKLDNVQINTQDAAQEALVKVNDAIVIKDKVRADYGAMQNRLENTLSNVTIQAENLKAAESRISDTDIAQEMTNFVRNQVLTQSAVAMLAQANSIPQMVMKLVQ